MSIFDDITNDDGRSYDKYVADQIDDRERKSGYSAECVNGHWDVRQVKPPPRAVSSKPFWIIWNPDHNAPPTAMFDSEKKALKVAESMAARFPEDRFYVCRAEAFAQQAPQPVQVTKLKGGAKK